MRDVEGDGARRALVALAGISLPLLAVRLLAATRIGFGDSEALYASYALHPQPAYLDHPGLIGAFARTIGARGALSLLEAPLVTAVLAPLLPWVSALACRVCDATWRRSLVVGALLALTPKTAIGLFRV